MSRISVRAFPAPRPVNFGKVGWCKWCGLRIPDVIDGKRSTQRMWHPDYAQEFFLHTRLDAQKKFLIDRDGRRCAFPGCGATPERWVSDQYERQTFIENCFDWRGAKPDDWQLRYWNRPSGSYRDWSIEDRATGTFVEIRRECALEVDHRIPLWSVRDLPDHERRWYFGPGNLWLLCPVCHKAKTRREAGERSALRRR